MNPEESWSELAREPSIDAKGLAKIQARMPRLRVDVTLTDAQIRLAFGKSVLEIALDRGLTTSDRPGRRSGVGAITPPDAKIADAILAAVAKAVEADVPARPHEPGFRASIPIALQGVHVPEGKGSLLWITFEIGQMEGSSLAHRWHLLLPAGKTRGYLHVDLPRGAASRDQLLAAFARAIRDGRGPRSTPLTDLRCASATPWLETTPIGVADELDLATARWGGATLFAARSDENATILLRCDGPSGFTEIARIDASDVALYPSPTGAHVLLELNRGVAKAFGQNADKHARRELLDVATGQRTLLVEKHELFAFGDTAGAALWSEGGARVALRGKASLAGETRFSVLVYDVRLATFVDATPLDGTFFPSHWDGSTLCLRGGPANGLVAFRWEPGRSDPRADAVLGLVSPGGRFALLVEGERTRVVDRRVGAFTGVLPATGGRFGHDDTWVTDEDEPRAFDLATFRYRYFAPPGQVQRRNLAETAPLAIFNDGSQWLWGSAPGFVAAATTTKIAADHPAPTLVRRAVAERRARRIEEASLLAAEDTTGEARRAIAALDARLRAEAALEAGNAKSESDVEGALARYEAAVHDAPELYEALHNCEVALGELGRADEQREVAGYLCERFPISSEAWLARSVALQHGGDVAGALAAIERALTLDADGADLEPRRARTVDLWHQRACVHLAGGRKDEALADVRAILAIDPDAKARLIADPDLAALRRNALLRA